MGIISSEKIAEVRKSLSDGAAKLGKSVEAYAAEEMAALHTSARKSILIGAGVGFGAGATVASIVAVLVK